MGSDAGLKDDVLNLWAGKKRPYHFYLLVTFPGFEICANAEKKSVLLLKWITSTQAYYMKW